MLSNDQNLTKIQSKLKTQRKQQQQQQQQPFCDHYTGQSALAGTSSYELEDFVAAKFQCPRAIANSNQHTRIREKTLEFSSTVSYEVK